MIVLWFLVLFFFLFVLLKSADYFIDNAVLMGNTLKIPSFVLGATIIAFGTSLPELAVSISAILKNTPAIISGTVIGSNISNVFLILGIALIIGKGFKINFKQNFAPIVILIVATALTSFFLWDNFYSATEGVISVIFLIFYIVYIVFFQKDDEEEEDEHEDVFSYKTIIYILLSGVGIWLGAEFGIVAVKEIALLMTIAEDVISLTIVALGTSLPELAVTLVAVKKKKYNIVLGNVIGSNIFNSLCVLGIPSVIGYYTGHEYRVFEAVFTNFSIPLMALSVLFLFVLSIFNKASKFFGFIFVVLYLLFIIGTFVNLDLLAFLKV